MTSINPLSPHFRGRKLPAFVDTVFISEEHSQKHSILPHVHQDYMELYFVYRGSGRYMVNNRYYELNQGDIVICNANTLHGERPSDERAIRSCSIGLKDVFIDDFPENCLVSEDETPVISTGLLEEQTASLFRTVNLLAADRMHLSDTCTSLSISLLLLTCDMLLSRRKNAVRSGRTCSPASLTQAYIDEHYHEQLTLSELGRELNMSEYYLAHCFKDEYHIPPMQYMMERRIGEAQQLLINTELPAGDISEALGFSSVSHFNAMFRKYVGIPPGKFRKSMKAMNT